MSINWFNVAIWSLVGTWVLVVGTLALMYWQTRTSQHLNSANAVMTLRERFDSPRMRTSRRALSERLLHTQEEGDLASVEVVTFFELVSTLTHRKVLDDDLVWEAFGTWISAYWWSLRHPVDHVARIRKDLFDPLVFHEFEWLSERMDVLDREFFGDTPVPEEDVEARRVLEREARLESHGPP